VLGPYLAKGDVLGHEAMGVVEEVGSSAGTLKVGDRVVVPFNTSCGSCWMCSRGLFAQCETTQNHAHGKGASLFGYTELYGSVPGGQAEYLRVPQAQFGPIVVPDGPPDERFLYLSDVLPTAWQAVQYANVAPGDSLAVIGLGPIGQFVVRVARHLGIENVFGVDLVPERLALARRWGAQVIDANDVDNVPEALLALTGGRGPDGVVDAVGMEAHGERLVAAVQSAVGLLPKPLAQKLTDKVALDRLSALRIAVKSVRRGGTVSVSGVYGGEIDPLPMMEMFDRGIQMRMGQAHVHRWSDDILPLLLDDADPLGCEDFATHHLSLDEAPHGYDMFQKKQDGCVKIVLRP
jgi:threonine dehydrogenase-like Zn-dependent dehydrogenase